MRRKCNLVPLNFHYITRMLAVVITAVCLFSTVATAQEEDEEIAIDSVYQENLYDQPEWLETGPGSAIQPRIIPDSVTRNLLMDPEFWYGDSSAVIQKEKAQVASVRKENAWLKPLLRTVIIGGFIAFIILFLVNSRVNIFRKRAREIKTEDDVELNEDIFSIPFKKELDKAIAQKQFRLAVRLHFLRLLKNMSDRNIIRYQQVYTNFDYLIQLSNTQYYKEFFRLTRHYEYAWYGKFTVSQTNFASIQQDFIKFEQSL